MVRGVRHEGCWEAVSCLRAGDKVIPAREPTNAYDRNAVPIFLEAGHRIGYVPREIACALAPLLDDGYKYLAMCTKILDRALPPIPVVDVDLYRPDAAVEGASVAQIWSPPGPAFEYRWLAFGGATFLILLWLWLNLQR